MQATYIGQEKEGLTKGDVYQLTITKFNGRRYKPGKDSNGWIDKVGEPDNRFMVYGGVPYSVYESGQAVLNDFKPANSNDGTAILLSKFLK